MINAFIYGTSCEALVHTLSHGTPRTTWELLDVTTQYATGKEAVQSNFSGKAKTVGHLSGGDGGDKPASSHRHRDKRNKDWKHRGRRWWPWPIVLLGFSPVGAVHARNTSRKCLSPPAHSTGVGQAPPQGLRYHEGLHM